MKATYFDQFKQKQYIQCNLVNVLGTNIDILAYNIKEINNNKMSEMSRRNSVKIIKGSMSINPYMITIENNHLSNNQQIYLTKWQV